MHLAQLNVGRIRYPTDDPRMAGFMDNLDRINALAEKSPGFVWRMTGEGNNNMDVTRPDDSGMNYNLSVWRSVEDLEHFVWKTVHVRFYNRKLEWFSQISEPHFVMWPIEEGMEPSLDEALVRLETLRREGSSDQAYGWEHLPHLKEWMAKRCG